MFHQRDASFTLDTLPLLNSDHETQAEAAFSTGAISAALQESHNIEMAPLERLATLIREEELEEKIEEIIVERADPVQEAAATELLSQIHKLKSAHISNILNNKKTELLALIVIGTVTLLAAGTFLHLYLEKQQQGIFGSETDYYKIGAVGIIEGTFLGVLLLTCSLAYSSLFPNELSKVIAANELQELIALGQKHGLTLNNDTALSAAIELLEQTFVASVSAVGAFGQNPLYIVAPGGPGFRVAAAESEVEGRQKLGCG